MNVIIVAVIIPLVVGVLSNVLTPHVVRFAKSERLTPLYTDLGKGFHLVMGTYLPIGLEFTSRVLLPICLTVVWMEDYLQKAIGSNSWELGFYRSIPYLLLALGVSTIIHVLYKKRMLD